MSPIGADTDLLRSEKLRPSWELVRRLQSRYNAAVAANLPPGEVRGEVDAQIHRVLGESRGLVVDVLDGLAALTRGDTTNLAQLSAMFERMEDANIDLARGKGADPTRSH